MKYSVWSSALMVLAAGLSLPAVAQSDVNGEVSLQTAASVPYLMGGVGLEDRTRIESRAGSFNLRLAFAEADGAYIVPDAVVVKRGADQILSVKGGGPLIYLNLPSGTYSVQAYYNGLQRLRQVQVSAHTPNVVLSWPTARFDPSAD